MYFLSTILCSIICPQQSRESNLCSYKKNFKHVQIGIRSHLRLLFPAEYPYVFP